MTSFYLYEKKGEIDVLKFKKVLVCLLAAAMTAGMMAGCQPGEGSQSETPSNGESGNEREEVELVWYVGGSGPQADIDTVAEEWNKYLKEKLNCTLKIIETDFGNYDTKMQTTIAGQTKFDMCYTANWSNNYYTNVNKKAFLELDDLIDEYAPDLKADIPEAGWEAVKVNGKIYAIPNQQIWAMTNVIYLTKDSVDKYNFDINSVTGLKDLEPLFEAFKKDNPDKYPMTFTSGGALDFLTFNMGYDELAGRHIPGVIMLDDEELKVVNQFELPQVQEHYKLMYEWNQKGYIRKDGSTVSDANADKKAGKHIMCFGGTYKPGGLQAEETNFGTELYEVKISDSWLPTSGITATMTAISQTSENPERAMEFLNLFNTDETLYNMVTKGLEGVHYERVDDTYIKLNPDSGYYPNADWMYGNQFLAYLNEGQGENDWADTIEINETAKPSPALGFSFDSTQVQTEMASVQAVVKEYELALDSGSVNPDEKLPEFLDKLEKAGSQKIMDEVQRQLDEWKANKE